MAKQRISEHETLYTGKLYEQAAVIRRNGLLVAPMPYVYLRRLELLGQESEAAQAFNSYVHTSDAFAYSHTGTFTLVRDFWNQYGLRRIGSFGKGDGRFYLNEGTYDAFAGDGLSVSFSREEQLLNRDMSLSDVLSHGVLRAAVRHPERTIQSNAWSPLLLEQYARRVVFPCFEQAMDVYVRETPERDEVRAFCVDRLDGGRRSGADGDGNLDDGSGCLVGVAPEALEAARQRSFALCERLSGEAYPALAGEQRQERADVIQREAVQRGAAQRETGQRVPYEAKSASGLMPGREHEIVVDEAGQYVRAEAVLQATNVIESGGKYPPALIEDFRNTLERNLWKEYGGSNE